MDPPAEASPQIARFVALDVHRAYVMVGAVDAQQTVVLTPKRVELTAFATWMAHNLTPTDAVVLEATTNAWTLYDQLEGQVGRVVVVSPTLVKLITQSTVKTDARDTLKLARLLAAGLLPAIWVPPHHVRDLRALVAYRQRLVRQRTQARNRLQSVLHRHNLVVPQGGLFTAKQRSWWETLPLSGVETFLVHQDLRLLDLLDPLIAEVDAELAKRSVAPEWQEDALFLLQLPGMGLITAMTVLAAIGAIDRFPTAKKLVGYAGLGASVHASGQVRYTGHITKEGRGELRTTMVEVAWRAVQHHPHWRHRFRDLARRLGERKAIVAIARKLLVVVWHVLMHRQTDRQAEDVAVARKLYAWAMVLHAARTEPLTAFTRRQLTRLGLGTELASFARCVHGREILLPPLEEVAVP
jgi:transposase